MSQQSIKPEQKKSNRQTPVAWQQPKHQAPTTPSIKEESKVANRDWVDHQACSLLQYINGIAKKL